MVYIAVLAWERRKQMEQPIRLTGLARCAG